MFCRPIGSITHPKEAQIPTSLRARGHRHMDGLVLKAGGWLGLAVSYEVSVNQDLRLAAGATIVVVLVGLFLLAAAVAPLRRRWARRRGLGNPMGVPQ